MEEAAKQPNLSVLMFPWLAHGHIYPYLELAKLLCKHNFTIFFCSTPINLKSIQASLSDLPIHLVDLHLPSPPDLPPDLHTTKHAPPHLIPHLFKAFHASKHAFSAILASLRPSLLIYDAFQPWAATAASALRIPSVHFATTGAAAYSFYYHHLNKKDIPFPHPALYLRPREWAVLQTIHYVSDHDGEDKDSDLFDFFSHSHDVVLMKTSRGVEGKYMDYLSHLIDKKIVSVGPLISPPTQASNDDDDEYSDIMDWLAKKEKSSTIFISFGSENYMSKNQMQEMANGLEASNANFLWVVRFPRGEEEKTRLEGHLPVGFVERVGERGKIVEGWAPQTRILAHESICGFISHCGMSSTIESVYFGVPVIGIPVKLDQPLNARLLVEAGVGVEVERDEEGDFRGGDVAAAIKQVAETGAVMRARAAEMRKTMRMEQESVIGEAADHLRRICTGRNVNM